MAGASLFCLSLSEPRTKSHATSAAYVVAPRAKMGSECIAAAPTAASPATERFVIPVAARTSGLPLFFFSSLFTISKERCHIEIHVPNGFDATLRRRAFRRFGDARERGCFGLIAVGDREHLHGGLSFFGE